MYMCNDFYPTICENDQVLNRVCSFMYQITTQVASLYFDVECCFIIDNIISYHVWIKYLIRFDNVKIGLRL